MPTHEDHSYGSLPVVVEVPGFGTISVSRELGQYIRSLKEGKDHWENRQTATWQNLRKLQDDLSIIGEALRKAALEHDLCSQYGEFVDQVNRRTSSHWLQHCEEDYEVRFVVTARPENRDELENAVDDGLKRRGFDESVDFVTEAVD